MITTHSRNKHVATICFFTVCDKVVVKHQKVSLFNLCQKCPLDAYSNFIIASLIGDSFDYL